MLRPLWNDDVRQEGCRAFNWSAPSAVQAGTQPIVAEARVGQWTADTGIVFRGSASEECSRRGAYMAVAITQAGVIWRRVEAAIAVADPALMQLRMAQYS